MSAEQDRVYTFFVVKEPDQPDRILVWDTQDITVGRSVDNDLHVDHEEMSRRHTVFTRTAKSHAVKNYSTSNSTYVNDRPVKTATLANKDRVKIAEVEMIFYLDATVEYASQLKGFSSPGEAGSSSPDATMLGMMDSVDGEDDFVVGAARDFDYDLHDSEGDLGEEPAPRNLDLELGDDPVLSETAKAVEREAWNLEDPPAAKPVAAAAGAGETFSLTLEIAGLGPEQRRALESMLGKVIALPALKIRLKGEDLG
jgi:pSer/pThr/pTyr-binding forkhead associated (FHA) protein